MTCITQMKNPELIKTSFLHCEWSQNMPTQREWVNEALETIEVEQMSFRLQNYEEKYVKKIII